MGLPPMCLDAHAHLGNLSFDTRPKHAMRHYEVGVSIGELSLPADFNGVLPWRMTDNRPFLRCLYAYGLCLWRLNHFEHQPVGSVECSLYAVIEPAKARL